MVRCKEFFTLKELRRAGRRLNKAHTAPGIDGVPNEILKEVIAVYAEILLEALLLTPVFERKVSFMNGRSRGWSFFRTGEKPLEDASYYKPICPLDTMGKLLGKIILQRLQSHMVGENSISENKSGFRKGTQDAKQAVVEIACKAKRGIDKRKGFCALISIDIRNAFNTARRKNRIEVMTRKKVPDYLLRMINDYLNDRCVIYEGDKWYLK